MTEFVRPEGSNVLGDFMPDTTQIYVKAECYQQQGHKKTFADFTHKKGKSQWFEKYRTCFRCGDGGHLIAQCTQMKQGRMSVEADHHHGNQFQNVSQIFTREQKGK